MEPQARAATLAQYVQSPDWLRRFGVAVVLFVLAFAVNLLFFELKPGNLWGQIYGWVAAVLMFGVAFFGLRRRMNKLAAKRSVGKAHTWLQFHLYAGALAMLLVFMHTGFALPTGPLNWLLWLLSIWVTLTGLYGVILQKYIPRSLASGLAIEAVYERIPDLVGQLRVKAEAVAAECPVEIRELYRKQIKPELAAPSKSLRYFADITGGITERLRPLVFVREILPAVEQERLDQLQSIYKTKLELDAHYTLQGALRWWLTLHLPPSLALIALVLVHIVVVYYY